MEFQKYMLPITAPNITPSSEELHTQCSPEVLRPPLSSEWEAMTAEYTSHLSPSRSKEKSSKSIQEFEMNTLFGA